MNKRTRWFAILLYWGSYATFQLNSIPHIAWVFHEYDEKSVNGINGFFLWAFAYAAALAIDVTIGWLGHVIALSDLKTRWYEKWLYIGFLIGLSSISWYFNWVFEMAHSPVVFNGVTAVWDISLIDQLSSMSQPTVGTITPILLSAMCVFVLSYTSILGKINQTAKQQAKSIPDLVKELADVGERARLEGEIKEASHTKKNDQDTAFVTSINAGKQIIGAARTLGSELSAGRKSGDEKKLIKLMHFFRDSPELLEQPESEVAIISELHLLFGNKEAMAKIWRERVKAALVKEKMEGEKQWTNDQAGLPASYENQRLVDTDPDQHSVQASILTHETNSHQSGELSRHTSQGGQFPMMMPGLDGEVQAMHHGTLSQGDLPHQMGEDEQTIQYKTQHRGGRRKQQDRRGRPARIA